MTDSAGRPETPAGPHDPPLRREPSDEVHARPPERVDAPARVSLLARMPRSAEPVAEHAHLALLTERFGVRPPDPRADQFSAGLGAFRFKWERHSGFSRCKFIAAGDGGEPFASPAIHLVPRDWRAGLPGQVMMAVHAVLTDAAEAAVDHETVSARHFGGNTLVGSEIDGGLPVKPDLATGASIPLLAGVVAPGVRRIRKAVSAGAHA
ncbi:MAG: DUF3422 family protein [Betaproteobacteria bacterium]